MWQHYTVVVNTSGYRPCRGHFTIGDKLTVKPGTYPQVRPGIRKMTINAFMEHSGCCIVSTDRYIIYYRDRIGTTLKATSTYPDSGEILCTRHRFRLNIFKELDKYCRRCTIYGDY